MKKSIANSFSHRLNEYKLIDISYRLINYSSIITEVY